MYNHNSQHDRNPRSMRSGWLGVFGLTLLLLLVGEVEQSSAQPPGYRDWYDSTAVDRVTITRKYPSDFPVGIFFYTYNQVAMNEVWDYMERINADYAIYSVEKGVGLFDYWGRYQTLINSAPSGKYVVPLAIYGGTHGVPSYINQSQEAREAVFYPFDTSEMRAIGALTNLLTVSRWYDNKFTRVDTTELRTNTFYQHSYPRYKNFSYREAVYSPSMAGDTVASGIAFRYQSGQTERWDSTFNGTSWVKTTNPINSSELFDGVNYAYPDPDHPGYHKGDYWNTFRLPHYLVVKGHLFEGGGGSNGDTMLVLNVYYEVDKWKTYRDSANVTGAPDTATTNMRFLYKSVAVTRGELAPVDPPPFSNWNAYREVAKRINFQREGMGGPTDTGVTAKSIDLEVIYVGTEKMALHSVSIRDSITHMLWTDDAEGVSYRNAVRREIDTMKSGLPDSTRLYFSESPILRRLIH